MCEILGIALSVEGITSGTVDFRCDCAVLRSSEGIGLCGMHKIPESQVGGMDGRVW